MQCQRRLQLTVALENRPGLLARVAETLAAHAVNIQALCVQDSVEQGVVRILAEPHETGLAALRGAGFDPIQAEVVVFATSSLPGVLAALAGALAREGINIEYIYGSEPTGGSAGMTVVVKVSATERALATIETLSTPRA
ncbi:MAG: ACT domain-containing protein [Verrucomicrobiota bacterium]